MSIENVTVVLSGEEPGGIGEAEASGGWLWLRAFAGNRLALAGLVVVVVLTLFSFLGPLFYHTDQIHTRIGMETLPPGSGHPLGSDDVGYDQLGRLMVAGQTTLEVAFGAAAVAVIVGVAWGAVAGYLGGLVDALMMRIVDALLAIPALLLLLYLATVFRPNVLMLIVVVGLTAWLVPARLVRAEALTLRSREYVLAAKTMGVRTPTLIVRHIVTNSIGTIVVNATFQVADAILVVAALSFLGLGIAPPATNWGAMLSNGLNYTYSGYWWLTYPPGIAIVLTVVAFNLIGDGLRDAFGLDTRRQ
jgi:peptide/nickel transport system permease protein